MAPTTNLRTVKDIMQRDVITVSEGEELALALQIMLWRELRHVPVLREGRVVGVLSERDILSHRYEDTNPHEIRGFVGDVMQHHPETIHSNALVADAAARMTLHRIGCLPVVDAGTLVGIISSTDILGESAWIPVEVSGSSKVPVGSVMTTKLVAARPDDPLGDAVGQMVQHDVRHLPIIDGMNRVIGLLSERDVRTVLGNPVGVLGGEAPASRLATIQVAHIMTADPRTIREDASITEAFRILTMERFGALPVLDEEDRLVGMVSYLDLLFWAHPNEVGSRPLALHG